MYLTILEKIIVFLLPTQLGLHFWPSFSRVVGIKIDYLSPTLYLLDIFLFLYIIANLHFLRKSILRNLHSIFVLVVYVVVNVVFAQSIPNTVFWWSRLCLYILFFVIFRARKVTWQQVKSPIFISTILIILLQCLQLFFQHSIGGVFYLFGERTFMSTSSGLARIAINGLDIIRPPSFFSHPNSLAGYLLVVYFLFAKFKSPLWQRLIICIGIILTFSKAALFTLAIVILFGFNPLLIIILSLLFSFLQLTLVGLNIPIQFISDRIFLLTSLPLIIFKNPLFGVGLGNYVVTLGSLLPGSHLLISKLQPVHNLPYLIMSEIGFIGTLLILVTIHRYRKKMMNKSTLQLLAIILMVGCFDHYFWTLSQNRLVVLLALALIV